jgi:hypothetical protein
MRQLSPLDTQLLMIESPTTLGHVDSLVMIGNAAQDAACGELFEEALDVALTLEGRQVHRVPFSEHAWLRATLSVR